jgi:hypothetical protein
MFLMSCYLMTKQRYDGHSLRVSGCFYLLGCILLSKNADTSFSVTIYRLEEDNVNLKNELICAKEKVCNDFMILQQIEEKHMQSQMHLQMARNEIDQLKEENVRFRSRIKKIEQKN